MTLAAAAAKEASGCASESERRLVAVSGKQDRLLYLCAYLLLNLSEDPDIERKMQKKVKVTTQLSALSNAVKSYLPAASKLESKHGVLADCCHCAPTQLRAELHASMYIRVSSPPEMLHSTCRLGHGSLGFQNARKSTTYAAQL